MTFEKIILGENENVKNASELKNVDVEVKSL